MGANPGIWGWIHQPPEASGGLKAKSLKCRWRQGVWRPSPSAQQFFNKNNAFLRIFIIMLSLVGYSYKIPKSESGLKSEVRHKFLL